MSDLKYSSLPHRSSNLLLFASAGDAKTRNHFDLFVEPRTGDVFLVIPGNYSLEDGSWEPLLVLIDNCSRNGVLATVRDVVDRCCARIMAAVERARGHHYATNIDLLVAEILEPILASSDLRSAIKTTTGKAGEGVA